ncbi:type II secretion system F family protein [Mixta tenebrionis]|uniref:Secretion system protein n=1 Tax=Mixta tenebrionis TaxID=2562439 RepID=A0A506V949_9GAMM|nr:type II secretion system F family protein [Mixta tenebrionis]TPW42056.1 secretion system protein [Mixta tenebrionis]
MPYFILLFGIAVLIVNAFRWRKLMRAVEHSAPPRQRSSRLSSLFSLWQEWKRYALGDGSWKAMKGLLIALAAIVLLLLLNANWLDFDNLIFIPLVLIAAVIIQIRVGRTLRRREFENRFPEVLSVVNAAVSAGNGIQQALHRCGEGIDGELGLLFHRIDRRLTLGEEPERVFNDAWQEYRYREFYFFVMVMLVSLQRGGQLRALISRLSRVITNSKNMARRKAAMTSEARMSAKIVAAIPLLFFCGMKYFSPENFDFIIEDPIGRIILYYVIASEVVGIGIIWLMMRKAT